MSLTREPFISQKFNDPVIVIYHGNCHDSHVAAFTLWLQLGDDATYYPTLSGKNPPDVRDKIVFILGIAYPYNIINQMIKDSKALLIIDNHKTYDEDLSLIPEKYKIFDKNECSSSLTWKYVYPNKLMPALYKYIRSRELWTKDMPNTDDFDSAFDLAIRDENGRFAFDMTKRYLDDNEITGLLAVGKIVNTYRSSIIEKIVSKAAFCPVYLKNGDLVVIAYINTPLLESDIGARCMEEFPFVDFCACYVVDSVKQVTSFSLRSTNKHIDVETIAKDHGGTGLRNASTCVIDEVCCRLNYKHLDPLPLFCVFNDRTLMIDHIGILTEDYIKLIKRKFPGKSLSINLKIEDDDDL